MTRTSAARRDWGRSLPDTHLLPLVSPPGRGTCPSASGRILDYRISDGQAPRKLQTSRQRPDPTDHRASGRESRPPQGCRLLPLPASRTVAAAGRDGLKPQSCLALLDGPQGARDIHKFTKIPKRRRARWIKFADDHFAGQVENTFRHRMAVPPETLARVRFIIHVVVEGVGAEGTVRVAETSAPGSARVHCPLDLTCVCSGPLKTLPGLVLWNRSA